jgi:hypothetical protein
MQFDTDNFMDTYEDRCPTFQGLSFAEEEMSYTLFTSTDSQLLFNLESYKQEELLSKEFIFVSRNGYSVPVQAEFAFSAILHELSYRGLLV